MLCEPRVAQDRGSRSGVHGTLVLLTIPAVGLQGVTQGGRGAARWLTRAREQCCLPAVPENAAAVLEQGLHPGQEVSLLAMPQGRECPGVEPQERPSRCVATRMSPTAGRQGQGRGPGQKRKWPAGEPPPLASAPCAQWCVY